MLTNLRSPSQGKFLKKINAKRLIPD